MIEPEEDAEGYQSAEVCVRNELGLHARPAARLAQEAQRFAAEITLTMDEQEVDAKSILDILTLAAPQGCDLVVRASGDDAAEALKTLIELFQTRFGEDK
ncbi:HPr family phosphocarrier protein [Desulfobaculum sp. SPO524]|uniref:HPr family phosphocarrier protein n=1 Tax=Desulfobaculum sp. SPO524 TaxID=3378071 RepID=UPI003854822F